MTTTVKMLCFCTILELDTITDMPNGKLLFLGITGITKLKLFLTYAVLELSGEVTSLKTKMRSVGTNIKGVTDTISELTHKNPLSTQPCE